MIGLVVVIVAVVILLWMVYSYATWKLASRRERPLPPLNTEQPKVWTVEDELRFEALRRQGIAELNDRRYGTEPKGLAWFKQGRK